MKIDAIKTLYNEWAETCGKDTMESWKLYEKINGKLLLAFKEPEYIKILGLISAYAELGMSDAFEAGFKTAMDLWKECYL